MQKQKNVNRKRGEAKEYHAGTIRLNGEDVRVLFTEHDLKRPIDRAKKQPEDFSKDGESVLGLFKIVKAVVKAAGGFL